MSKVFIAAMSLVAFAIVGGTLGLASAVHVAKSVGGHAHSSTNQDHHHHTPGWSGAGAGGG